MGQNTAYRITYCDCDGIYQSQEVDSYSEMLGLIKALKSIGCTGINWRAI